MKRLTIIFTILLALVLSYPAASSEAASCTNWTAHFSPKGGCTEAIVKEIGKAIPL